MNSADREKRESASIATAVGEEGEEGQTHEGKDGRPFYKITIDFLVGCDLGTDHLNRLRPRPSQLLRLHRPSVHKGDLIREALERSSRQLVCSQSRAFFSLPSAKKARRLLAKHREAVGHTAPIADHLPHGTKHVRNGG